MAQEGTPDKSSDESASEFSQTIFGAKNYQIGLSDRMSIRSNSLSVPVARQ